MLIRLFLILFCFSCTVLAFAQRARGFVLDGYIKNLPESTEVYLIKGPTGSDTVAKAIAVGEKFQFKGIVPLEPEIHWIKIDTAVSTIPSKAIWMVNDQLYIKSSFGQWPEVEVAGSLPHSEFKYLTELILKIIRRHDEFQRQLNKSTRGTKLDSISMNAQELDSLKRKVTFFERQIKSAEEEIKRTMLEYADQHSGSLYVPFVLNVYLNNLLTLDEVTHAYKKLSNKSRNSFYGRKLKASLDVGEIDIGKVIGNFSGYTPQGEKISLRQISKRNKFTLIDFWASWCKPCREETPNLRRAFELYGSKGFAILSVTSDYNVSAWKKAISQDKMTWYHLIDKEHSAAVSKMFGITSIPAYFLVDQQGKILAIDTNIINALNGVSGVNEGCLRGNKLIERLEELFGR